GTPAASGFGSGGPSAGVNQSRGIPGYAATYRTVASPTRASSPASIGIGPGWAGSHRGSASHRPSAYRVLRSSVYDPEGPRASRLAANVALSFATRRSPAERNRGGSANVAWWCADGVVTRRRPA